VVATEAQYTWCIIFLDLGFLDLKIYPHFRYETSIHTLVLILVLALKGYFSVLQLTRGALCCSRSSSAQYSSMMLCSVQWNVSITKSCRWWRFIRNFVTLKHIKMSHRCLHRRFSRAAAIGLNESKDLCARLHWSIRVARPWNSWPNPKLKMFTLSHAISIPFNRNCDERAGECGYVPSMFIF
jgi:hypothetical protein